MDRTRAHRVVDALRSRNVFAHVKLPYAGIARYGIRVVLPDGREAIWGTEGVAGLEAQVVRDGVLVGFVPVIQGSESFEEGQIIEAIARADYDAPAMAAQRAVASRGGSPAGLRAGPRCAG